jgi:hypothetical protein
VAAEAGKAGRGESIAVKTRFLVKVFKIENVKEYGKDAGDVRDDIVEQTEDQLNSVTDFYTQDQGDSLREIAYRWANTHEYLELKAEVKLGEAILKHFESMTGPTLDRAKLIDFFKYKVAGRKEMLSRLGQPQPQPQPA